MQKIQKGDTIKVIAGAHKGKTAKVLSVQPSRRAVTLEGIGERKRFVKANTLGRTGGVKDIHVAMPVHKVALIHPTDASKTTRAGFTTDKDGQKARVARQASNKPITQTKSKAKGKETK